MRSSKCSLSLRKVILPIDICLGASVGHILLSETFLFFDGDLQANSPLVILVVHKQ